MGFSAEVHWSSEAQVVFLDQGVSVASNAPIPGAEAVGSGTSHVLIDLGSDEYTRGRPHPMIDPTVRDEELTKALADPTLAVILLDVVIGFRCPSRSGGNNRSGCSGRRD